MLGKLNIFAYSLAVGAAGQQWFYGRLFAHCPAWIVWGVLFLPWITVHLISFCNRPPFGPRPFRLCLLFVMCWYALVTIAAEVLQSFFHFPADGQLPITSARVLMYLGFVSFIPFARAIVVLRRHEAKPDV